MSLKNLFNIPVEKQIANISFLVYQVEYERFDDGLMVGAWLGTLNMVNFDIAQLYAIKKDTPERLALDRLLASCLTVKVDAGEPVRLQPADLDGMPAAMVGEALAVVLEVNMDFFFHMLQRATPTAIRLGTWTGLVLPSSSSAPATIPTPSVATPSDSSPAS